MLWCWTRDKDPIISADMNTKISVRICIVWSATLLPADISSRYCGIYHRIEKVLIGPQWYASDLAYLQITGYSHSVLRISPRNVFGNSLEAPRWGAFFWRIKKNCICTLLLKKVHHLELLSGPLLIGCGERVTFLTFRITYLLIWDHLTETMYWMQPLLSDSSDLTVELPEPTEIMRNNLTYGRCNY